MERDTCVHKLDEGERQGRTEQLTWESLILKHGSSSMTFKRNSIFLCFPVLDSYLSAKLLSGYDMLVQKEATEIQELVTVSVEIIAHLVGEAGLVSAAGSTRDLKQCSLFLRETLFKWQKTYFRLLYTFESTLLNKFYSPSKTQCSVHIFILLAWGLFAVPWYRSAWKFTLSLIVKQIHGNS